MSELIQMDVPSPALESPVLVLAFEGWNDAGESASMALDFLSMACQAVPFARIEPEIFFDFTARRPRICLKPMGERAILWPEFEFRSGRTGGRDLIFGCGPEPHLRWKYFSEHLIEVARSHGVKQVLLLGAFLADLVYSRPVGITGFSSSGVHPSNLDLDVASYEGPTGIVGVLSESFRTEGLDVLSLWAGLPHYIDLKPNPRGALALLEKVNECLGIVLDLDPLREESASFERQVSMMVAEDPELSAYVRELKRREFVQ